MKFLTELSDEDFLRHCWQIADVAEKVLEKSKIMELRKVLPVLTGEETPEELEQKKKEQAKKNIQAMAKSLLFDNAAATAKLLPLLYEPDVDENGVVENIGPFKKMRAVKELLNNDDVLDFLLWCLPLVLAGTDA